MSSIRILITDDHLIVREGLRLILETADGFDVVGEAADGAECFRISRDLSPDVVLMDLQMPGMDGIQPSAICAGNTRKSPSLSSPHITKMS